MKYLFSISFFFLTVFGVGAQDTTTATDTIKTDTVATDSIPPDTLSKFARFNKKMERFFKVFPVPIVSYSTETKSVFGLAKFNTVDLVKGDTVSTESSFSELITFSTSGQFKVVLASNIYLNKNKFNIKGAVAYIEFPEYILGVGNVVSRDSVEQIKSNRLPFSNAFLVGINKPNTLYVGVFQEYKNYLKVEQDSNGFLVRNQYPGYQGGVLSGAGIGLIYDARSNRYYPETGMYLASTFEFFGSYLGSDFRYDAFLFDIRKYISPWPNHVFAAQFYSEINNGTVPFFALGMLGGTERMRGYYLGAIRDKVVMDAQIEYRLHIWSIFGIVAFANAGRVAPDVKSMNFDGLWYGGGVGFRICVDSKSKVNLRLDFGYGQEGSKAFIFGFSEAF